jgi:hypothetical protein
VVAETIVVNEDISGTRKKSNIRNKKSVSFKQTIRARTSETCVGGINEFKDGIQPGTSLRLCLG